MLTLKHLVRTAGQYTFRDIKGFIVAIDTECETRINDQACMLIAFGCTSNRDIPTKKIWTSLDRELFIRATDEAINDWLAMPIKKTIVETYDETDAFNFKIALLRRLHPLFLAWSNTLGIVLDKGMNFKRMRYVYCPYELPIGDYISSVQWMHQLNDVMMLVRQDKTAKGNSRVTVQVFHAQTECSYFSLDIDHDESRQPETFWQIVIQPIITKIHQALAQHPTWQRPVEMELAFGTGLTDIVVQTVRFELTRLGLVK